MNKWLLLTFLALIALSSGCASARKGIGDNVTVPKIIDIVPGKTTLAQVRTIFGKPDILKKLENSVEEYTYLQGKNDSVSWLVLSGYLLYHPTEAFSGSRILIIRFADGLVKRFFATDGKLTLKKGFKEDNSEDNSNEGK